MAYNRPSWREIDRKRDGAAPFRKKCSQENVHSTQYNKYKADLHRLFDQGLVGELLKKMAKNELQSNEITHKEFTTSNKTNATSNNKDRDTRSKSNKRAPFASIKYRSRFQLIRAIVNAENTRKLHTSIDELVERFGLPDDLEVLGHAVTHPNEKIVRQALNKINILLTLNNNSSKKVSRRASLKEKLRTILQTTSDPKIYDLATEVEQKL